MAPNHTNPGPQLHQSRAKPAALNRTNPGPQYREYSVPTRESALEVCCIPSGRAGNTEPSRPGRPCRRPPTGAPPALYRLGEGGDPERCLPVRVSPVGRARPKPRV